ncbi:MAG: arginine--tRNA ligase [Candidatus Obscuribacterales bacterium]|nr:arginine--tRNA ligase [Candidatus Obscuribacterales bacterium]
MIKVAIKESLEKALSGACKNGLLGQLEQPDTAIVIERPRSPEHGDYACGVALKLAGKAKMPPLKIAQTLADAVGSDIANYASAEVAPPGYINFRLQKDVLQEVIKNIHKNGPDYGRSEVGGGTKVLIEYVSANPTGALHIGHGRGAVFGSCLANLMRFGGFKVEEEFYVNDAGVQIAQLGACAWALYKNRFGKEAEYPTEGYPAESLQGYVDEIVAKHKDEFMSLDDDAGVKVMGLTAKAIIEDSQRRLLERLGVSFDRWFSELPLHTEGKVDQAIDVLKSSSLVYESEGAVWLKAKELGDERDRVLVKSDGTKTYLAGDAAYHLNKFQRGYDLLINIWGSDHHGQVPGLKAVIAALGHKPEQLEVILTQMVNLSRDGQVVRMSKRMGTIIYLEDLIDEVGRDSVRYYLAESSPQNAISFDLELAKKTSRENPAFYIQYAHARCCAILRRALEPTLNQETQKEEPALVSAEEWAEWKRTYAQSPEVFAHVFEDDPEVFVHQKKLIMQLALFPEEVEESVISRQPGRLARYAYDVANDLQKFYEVSRVISDDRQVMKARLGLIDATKQVLANALGIIGVTAVERM